MASRQKANSGDRITVYGVGALPIEIEMGGGEVSTAPQLQALIIDFVR